MKDIVLKLSSLSTPLLVTLSLLIALATARAFPLGLDLAFPGMPHQIAAEKFAFIVHIAAASFALALGAVQMIKAIRAKMLSAHRWIGRTYALSVALGGISGLWIAFNIDNWLALIGFSLLALLWLFTTTKAVLFARAKQISQHRKWMIYSFALTFAAVTLRLQLAVFTFGFGLQYDVVDMILAWSCWVPNIAFALWYTKAG